MRGVHTDLLRQFCGRLPEGVALLRARPDAGVIDVTFAGREQHLHFADDALSALPDEAARDGRHVWGTDLPAVECALRFLSIQLEESLATRRPREHGRWTHTGSGFEPGAPRDSA